MFQKITPDHVESIMMAFSASIVNLSRGFTGQMIGVWMNRNFIGITATDLTNYSACIWIGIACCFYEMAIARLIPLNSDIKSQFNQK